MKTISNIDNNSTKNNAENSCVMTMTTIKSGKMTILMAGSGTVAIDWGDGSKIKTYRLGVYVKNWLDRDNSQKFAYHHNYSGSSFRTITITGKNITDLNCRKNQLTNLDVSNNSNLRELYCDNNQLTNLDVSKNTLLTKLNCSNNQLKSLDVSKNAAMIYLNCRLNQLTCSALNALFEKLHDNRVEKSIRYTSNNPETDSCNWNIAMDKGWGIC